MVEIILMLLVACLVPVNSKGQNTPLVAISDTTTSFKIGNHWIIPKVAFEFNALKKSSDTLHLVTCSPYVYFPFGLIKNKSGLKSSLLQMFTVTANKKEKFINYDISPDTLWNELVELNLGSNKLNLFFDNDPEASMHSYIANGIIYDNKVKFSHDIKIGIKMLDFCKIFFKNFPQELENKYKVIVFESCITSIRHFYSFDHGKLSFVKFVSD